MLELVCEQNEQFIVHCEGYIDDSMTHFPLVQEFITNQVYNHLDFFTVEGDLQSTQDKISDYSRYVTLEFINIVTEIINLPVDDEMKHYLINEDLRGWLAKKSKDTKFAAKDVLRRTGASVLDSLSQAGKVATPITMPAALLTMYGFVSSSAGTTMGTAALGIGKLVSTLAAPSLAGAASALAATAGPMSVAAAAIMTAPIGLVAFTGFMVPVFLTLLAMKVMKKKDIKLLSNLDFKLQELMKKVKLDHKQANLHSADMYKSCLSGDCARFKDLYDKSDDSDKKDKARLDFLTCSVECYLKSFMKTLSIILDKFIEYLKSKDIPVKGVSSFEQLMRMPTGDKVLDTLTNEIAERFNDLITVLLKHDVGLQRRHYGNIDKLVQHLTSK